MPFLIEQVEKALATQNAAWPHYHPDILALKQSVNYPIIIDYLTGKSSSLQGIQPDNYISYWGTLLNLLNSLEKPSANDQLVLDIIFDVSMEDYLKGYFMLWLLLYAAKHPSDAAFHAVLNSYRKYKLTDDEILSYILAALNDAYTSKNVSLDENTPLKRFLVNCIKNARQMVAPGHHFGGYNWNFTYFKLLEEARPEWAPQYAMHGAIMSNPEPLQMLLSYKNGQYMPLLIEYLRNMQNTNRASIKAKLYTTLFLYEADENKYRDLAAELAHQYLEHSRSQGHEYIHWEGGYSLKEFKDHALNHMGYTSCAFHLLLKHDQANGLQMLESWIQRISFVPFQTLLVLHHHLGKNAFPYLIKVLESENFKGNVEYYKNLFTLMQEHFDAQAYVPAIWRLTGTKSKPMKELMASTLAEIDADAETKAIALLENKKVEHRQTAAIILSRFSTATAKEAINKVLDKETNDDARDILLQTIADSLPQQASREMVDSMISAAKQRGKLSKPVEPWLDENELPDLFYTDGTKVNPDAVRFLLYRMSRVKSMRSDAEARLLLQQLNKQRSSPFAMHLMKLFLDHHAKPEHKFLIALAALLGDDAVTDKIRTTINNWIEGTRVKMAEHGVGALALQGSDKALRWVEWYSRKYKNKKANVGQAATQALEDAAEELQITTHELGDRIVPDFGFDGLFRHFNIDNDEYRAFVDSNFKLAFFNEDNKKLKSLPASASNELKDEFKSLAKEVRDVVRSQSSRLEHYLVVQRRWTAAQWQQFFLNNPIMFIYATKLLWGIYENGKLTQGFLCQEDTTLVDQNDNELSLPEHSMIGIVHPMQLSPEDLQVWRRKFFDLSIEPIFPQLERPYSVVNDEEKNVTIVKKFVGSKTDPASIRGTLEKYGWGKATGDGGHIDFFLYHDHAGHMRALLEVEGVYVYFTTDVEAKLGKLYFINTAKEKNRWFSMPRDEKDERLIPLGALPPVFYSEVMASIGAIRLKQ